MTPDSPYIEDESRWTEAQAYIAALEAELGLDGTADVQTKMNLPDYAPRSAPMWQRLAVAELRADAFREVVARSHNHVCHVPHCRGCALLARTPAEWLALAQAKEGL